MQVSEAQAKAVAKWWASKIIAPEFKTLSNEERRQGSSLGAAMAEVMAKLTAKGVSPEQADKFADELAKRLCERGELYLSVDYGPCGTLADAAEAVGIKVEMNTFPWKTRTVIDNEGKVKASHGYGAEFQEVPLESQQAEQETK